MKDRNAIIESGMLEMYLLGLIPDKELLTLEKMLAEDEILAQKYAEIEQDFENVSLENAIQPPDFIKEDLFAAIREDYANVRTLPEENASIEKPVKKSQTFMWIAASLAAIFMVSSLWMFTQWDSTKTDLKTTQQELDNINHGFIKDDLKQSRIITAELKLKKKKIELINIYVPNGNPVDTEKYEYKKSWLKKFISNVEKKIQKNSNILIAGDFNIIPEEIDVHDFKRYENDALGRLEIRKKYRELINLGFKDVYRFKNKTKQEYTFWDYFAGSWQKNYGMRIDHFLLSNSLIENIKSININKKPRSKEKPSDHTPIELEII